MSRKLSRYEQITGLRETSPNAVLHHRFSLRSLIQVDLLDANESLDRRIFAHFAPVLTA
jgi:hypothetical protein